MAVLNADKEGFLRSETSLIQTIHRRAAGGSGILHADTVTPPPHGRNGAPPENSGRFRADTIITPSHERAPDIRPRATERSGRRNAAGANSGRLQCRPHGIIESAGRQNHHPKDVREILEISKTRRSAARKFRTLKAHGKPKNKGRRISKSEDTKTDKPKKLTEAERTAEIAKLEQEMKEASKLLEFEYAAVLRDRIIELRGGK